MPRFKIFNKRNLKKFANELFDEGEFFPLCHGEICRLNGEIVHCALGQLHFEFCGPTHREATKSEIKEELDNMYMGDGSLQFPIVDGSLDESRGVIIHGITENEVVNNLMAIVRSQKDADLSSLRDRLIRIPNVNDSVVGENKRNRTKRAKLVKKALIDIADKYLT